jgi:hypothetical protein
MQRPSFLGWLLLPLLAVVVVPAGAQVRIDAGAALGTQSYESSSDGARLLPELEVGMRGSHAGAALAFEQADLDGGHEQALHGDVTWRRELPHHFSLTGGVGPSAVLFYGTRWTWNAEAEIARQFGKAEIFARVRYFDYRVDLFRYVASPSTPAVYLGARIAVFSR